MWLRGAVTGLLLVFLTTIVNAVASNSVGPDSPAASKTSSTRNAPFSAEVVTEYDRTLDKGGHIHRESLGKVFRDSQGRVRTESQPATVQSGSEKYDHITINDPVRQVIIYLNPKNKTATILHFGEVTPAAPLSAGKHAKSKEKSTFHVGGQPGIGSGPLDTLGVPNVPSGQASTAADSALPAKDTNSSRMNATTFSNTAGATIVPLGTLNIEGVNATGTRTTRTINAGTMGNDKAIVSISDVWVSSDLKVTVLTETDDGQAGHSTMKLVNIVRSEPSPTLFQIPADYTVQENAAVVRSRP